MLSLKNSSDLVRSLRNIGSNEEVPLSVIDIAEAAATYIEAAERDARRYRWLRERVCWYYPSAEGCEQKDAYLVITGYGDNYGNLSAVDDAIDYELAREGEA